MESRPTTPPSQGSKEALALSSLDAESFPPPVRRRMRRRRRSVRRRIVDGLMPFCILIGLVLFAAGLVRIVEIGAASESKTRRDREIKLLDLAPPASLSYQLASDEDRARMNARSIRSKHGSAPKNQVAYQLSLQIEAQRSLLESFPAPGQKPAGSADVIDWSLFDAGSEDPRSILQRGRSQR